MVTSPTPTALDEALAVLEMSDDCTVHEVYRIEEARRIAKRLSASFPSWRIRVLPVSSEPEQEGDAASTAVDQLIDALEHLYSKQDRETGLVKLRALDDAALVLVGQMLVHRSACRCCADRCTAIEEAAECYALHGPEGELRDRLAEWDEANLHPEGWRRMFLDEIECWPEKTKGVLEEWEEYEESLPPEIRAKVPTPEELSV